MKTIYVIQWFDTIARYSDGHNVSRWVDINSLADLDKAKDEFNLFSNDDKYGFNNHPLRLIKRTINEEALGEYNGR